MENFACGSIIFYLYMLRNIYLNLIFMITLCILDSDIIRVYKIMHGLILAFVLDDRISMIFAILFLAARIAFKDVEFQIRENTRRDIFFVVFISMILIAIADRSIMASIFTMIALVNMK